MASLNSVPSLTSFIQHLFPRGRTVPPHLNQYKIRAMNQWLSRWLAMNFSEISYIRVRKWTKLNFPLNKYTTRCNRSWNKSKFDQHEARDLAQLIQPVGSPPSWRRLIDPDQAATFSH